ncbi:MAG TPA: DUF1127 domain-containing protein [Caldimonas sp.]|jgi:uncharacterized protein YjiS (DUF1127 family)|nr:DUF1127 domain-containing protein [Caldimonas sp.]HEX2541865.1 DUF1127 domain-containing protein [Caldimonas sp.]
MHQPTTLTFAPAADPWRRLVDKLGAIAAAWRRHRQARSTYLSLSELDERTLRDLGFRRSELASIAQDAAWPHRSERARWLQAPRF